MSFTGILWRRASVMLSVALIACGQSTAPGAREVAGNSTRVKERPTTWQPATVLVYVDLSSSVRLDHGFDALQQLARQVRAGDRVIVFPAGRGSGALRPALDTILPGTRLDRLVQGAGLEVGRNAERAHRRRAEFSSNLHRAVQDLARSYGRPNETRLVETVCHAGDLARRLALEGDGEPHVIALLLSDGIEASPLANLTARVPPAASAQRFGTQLRAGGLCDLAAPLSVRMVGISHGSDTRALIRWWEHALAALGATVLPGDVATAPITSML
jgi:hypothetical protein